MHSIICFISDFGHGDTWVGVCHAVMHQACPQASIVDLDHTIPAFDVRKGAAVAAAGVHQLPGAIHLVVIDPGVGSDRMDICIQTAAGTVLVGPDNGVLLPAAARAGGVRHAWAIDQAKIDVRSPLPTFHARDVLAPAAAALACGVSPGSLGNPIDTDALVGAPFGEFERQGDTVVGEVLDVDRFGSMRFNVPSEEFHGHGSTGGTLEISLGHNTLSVPYRRTYADVQRGEPVALVDSSGWLTLAVNMGDAADRYGVTPGAPVRIRRLG